MGQTNSNIWIEANSAVNDSMQGRAVSLLPNGFSETVNQEVDYPHMETMTIMSLQTTQTRHRDVNGSKPPLHKKINRAGPNNFGRLREAY